MVHTDSLAILALLLDFSSAVNLRRVPEVKNSTVTGWNSSSSAIPSSSSKSALLHTSPKPSSSSSSKPAYSSHSYKFSPSNSSQPYGPTGTGVPPKEQCNGGPTLNVLDASLDWWFGRTLYNAVSTISIQFNGNDSQTGWTLLPATTPFDVSSALSSDTCTSSLTYNTKYNTSFWGVDCTPAPTPVAASTTIITQTAYETLTTSTGTGTSIPDVIVTPPPATITVPEATSFSEGTPFVYFSAYEIITKSPILRANSTVGCATTTQTTSMETPFGFAYEGANVNGSSVVGAGVTGDVNPAFLQIAGVKFAKAGSWVAAPTVALVVQEVYAAQAVLAATVEGTTLQVPSPTLPTGLSPIGPETPGRTPTMTAGRTETTQQFLLVPTPSTPGNQGPGPGQTPPPPPPPPDNGPKTVVPFVGNSNGQDITLNIPVNPSQTVVTAGFSGGTIVATRLPPQETPGVVGGFISSIVAGVRPGRPGRQSPTNAAQALSNAAATFPGANPTASAILQGINPQNQGIPQRVPVITFGGRTVTGNAQTQFRVGPSATLTPGGTAVVQGTTLSLLPAGTSVVVNGQTEEVSVATITPAPAPFLTIGGQRYTANGGSTYYINGQPLTPGGVVTNDGTTISLGPKASNIVVNGETESLASPAQVTPAPALTVGGQTYTDVGGSTYVINGQTLTPGGVITADGTTISLGPGASSIVVNGLTQSLSPGGVASATITSLPVLTIGSETFAPVNGGPTYVINGETLTPGEVETVSVDGTTFIVTLYPGATAVVIKTEDASGQITAITYETLGPDAPGSSVTAYVSASAGSRSSAGPSASSSYTPVLAQGGSASVSVQMGLLAVAVGSLVLAVWL